MFCGDNDGDNDNPQRADQEAWDKGMNLPVGVPPLTSLYLYISGSCNLICRHCWISPSYLPGKNGGQFIPLEYVHKAVEEAKPLGLSSTKLTGGEPTLHPHFMEIVALLDSAGLDVTIETNGTLIDADLAIFLKKKSHVSFISVSLDGATVEVHETLRLVPGSYEKALSGIRYLVEAGFHPQIICTLHQGNISEIDDVLTLAEQLGCGSVKFNHLQRIGRGEQFADRNGLEVSEVIQLYKRIASEFSSRHKIPIHFDSPFAFYSIRKLIDDSLSRCKVRNILGMLAGGDLSLCGIGVTVPELIYGNIAHDDLWQVWCYSPGLIRLRELIPAQLEGICGECLHRDLCQGACIANNYHSSGKLNSAHKFCSLAHEAGLFPEVRKR